MYMKTRLKREEGREGESKRRGEKEWRERKRRERGDRGEIEERGNKKMMGRVLTPI